MSMQSNLEECRRILGLQMESRVVAGQPPKAAKWLAENSLAPGQRLRVWISRGADDFHTVQVMSEDLSECSQCSSEYRVRCFDCDDGDEIGVLTVEGRKAYLNGAPINKVSLETPRRRIGLAERRQFGRGSWYLGAVNVTKQEIELTFKLNLLMGQATPTDLVSRCESLSKGIREVSAQLYKDLSDIAQLPNTKSNGQGAFRFDGPDKDGSNLVWIIAWMYRGEAKDVKARLKDLQWLVK
jgi:hypothetical protein